MAGYLFGEIVLSFISYGSGWDTVLGRDCGTRGILMVSSDPFHPVAFIYKVFLERGVGKSFFA